MLYVAKEFGSDVALEKTGLFGKVHNGIGKKFIYWSGSQIQYSKTTGIFSFDPKKDLVFYKVDDEKKVVTVYAIVDQRLDYLDIIRGL